jgi:cytochrome bd ubiquinol oxidase subunit II
LATGWDRAIRFYLPLDVALPTLVMLPIIFGYTIFVYWIFSGKLREGEGYH